MMSVIEKITKFNSWKSMTIFMLGLFFYGLYSFSVAPVQIFRIFIIIVIGVVLDYVIHFLQKTGRNHFPVSGLISALIVSVLLPPDVGFFVGVVAIGAAILSKHFLIYKHRHVFNPAAFGVVTVVAVFGTNLAWWPDSFLWPVIILGLFLTWKVKKFWQVGAFLTFYLLVFALRGNLSTIDSNTLYLIPWFFALFMLTEPMTSPPGKFREIMFGFSVAILVLIFSFLPFVGNVPLVWALLAGNIIKIGLMKI